MDLSFLSFIGDAGTGLIELFPRRTIVDTTQAAVIWRWGKSPKSLGPGVHWWWPLVDVFAVMEIQSTTVDICKQAVETRSGDTVAVSGWLTYKVENAWSALTGFTDFDDTLQETAAGIISDVVYELDMPELPHLKQELSKRLTDKLGDVIKVVDFSVSDYFKAQHRLLQWQP